MTEPTTPEERKLWSHIAEMAVPGGVDSWPDLTVLRLVNDVNRLEAERDDWEDQAKVRVSAMAATLGAVEARHRTLAEAIQSFLAAWDGPVDPPDFDRDWIDPLRAVLRERETVAPEGLRPDESDDYS